MKKLIIILVTVVLLAGVAWAGDVDWKGGDTLTIKKICMMICYNNFRLNEKTCECEKEFGSCPLCGTKGDRLGWIAIGVGDKYFANTGWIPSMDLYACPKCHLLFWE